MVAEMLDKTPMIEGDFFNLNTRAVSSDASATATDNGRYFNRELSWLQFDLRILDEAANPDVPLLERLKFLGISGSNLDEFFSVRVAALQSLVRHGVQKISVDGLTPQEQLTSITAEVQDVLDRQQAVWRDLTKALKKERIEILTLDDLKKREMDKIEDMFMEQIFPVLTPIAIDPAHPFPFIPNGEFALALELESPADGRRLEALLPVPHQLPRFIRLDDTAKGKVRFLPLEAMMELYVPRIFPGYSTKSACAFRLLRDSDLEVEEEAEDLVREFETALKRRRRGVVIRLEFSSDAGTGIRDKICEELEAENPQVVTIQGLIGIADVSEIVVQERGDLLFPPYRPRTPERVMDHDGDIFAAIRQKDMLLHHPYETFDTVVQFLNQAARDPDVLAIKQTLYRTSNQSSIVTALCEAAELGKSVTAVVELKARFDEAANIRQSRRLERAGAQVIYGFVDWKTHAKISAVVRREGNQLRTYTHFGTGNYHPITANFYTDLSLFTCDPALGRDATKIFNYVSGYARPDELENLAIAPLTLKKQLLEMMAAEADHARAGRPAKIWAKLNALIEPDVIDALYEASQAGVEIDLVVRSICGLRPGIKGLSENIRVKSVVGRFLEHARVACFGNGHGLPSEKSRVFISSADWMGRNLNRRVESFVEIKNPTVRAQIQDQVMFANLADQAQSWVLQPDGRYIRHNAIGDTEPFSCHQFFMETPSLSGRGLAGRKGEPEPLV